MTNQRIIYVLRPYPNPFGGVANIYRHVEILHAHGLPAFVALASMPERDFYNSSAPVILHDGRLRDEVRDGDIFVIPEGYAEEVRELADTSARRLMFCQNHHYLPFGDDPASGFQEFGVDWVIASSEAIRDFFFDVYGIADVPILPCAIDPVTAAPSDRKKLQIAYMPRKLPRELAFLRAAFERRHLRYADVPWVAIEDVPHSDALRILGDSAVFFSLAYRESFGLPPLEAMACGCLVAGFDGGGGREYMSAENGWWAEAGDWKSAIDGLACALDMFQSRGSEFEARREAARITVSRYHPERLEAALLAYWNTELSPANRDEGRRQNFEHDSNVMSIDFGLDA